MDGCGTTLSISALACAIAKGKSNEKIAHLGVLLTQLGDSLTTIASTNEFCSNNREETINIT